MKFSKMCLRGIPPNLKKDQFELFKKILSEILENLIVDVNTIVPEFPIKNFFSKCDQIRSFLWIWSHVLKKSLMENVIFCAILPFFLSYLEDLLCYTLVLHLIKTWHFYQQQYPKSYPKM